MTNYLAYAGIGSRESPKHVLDVMQYLGGYLFAEGWTLRSGHADGADKAFEEGVDREWDRNDRADFGYEIYLPWKGFNGSKSPFHPENIPFTDQEISLAENTHPAWHRCSPSARRMHTRNVRQILGCEEINGPTVVPVKFVICWTEGGKMKGGTAQALRIAQSCQIAVINLGEAMTPAGLEALVLEIDELQKSFRKEPT